MAANRSQQLMQSGKRELGLGLDPLGGERFDPLLSRVSLHLLQQGGLSDPGRACNEQRAALLGQPIDERLGARKVRVSSDEGR